MFTVIKNLEYQGLQFFTQEQFTHQAYQRYLISSTMKNRFCYFHLLTLLFQQQVLRQLDFCINLEKYLKWLLFW
ncbi:hypothetical protein TTHERM_001495770, partial (macronuclear) [Tetrahymena thermophila SB210]